MLRKGCRESTAKGAHKSTHATAVAEPPASGSSYLAFRYYPILIGRVKAPNKVHVPGWQGEEKGTGARGAPVPEVGRGVKFKHAEFRSSESHPNEARVNSP